MKKLVRTWSGLRVAIAVAMLACTAASGLAQEQPQQNAKAAELQLPLAARCLAFSPDGKSLAVAHGNNEGSGRLVVWNLATRKPRFVKDGATVVASVAISPDGELLAVGSFTPMLRLFDPLTGQVRREWKAHEQHIRSVVFRPSSDQIATASYDRTIKLWDPASGEVRRELKGHKTPLRAITISPDGKWLASAGGEEDVLRLWSLEDEDQPPREIRMPGYVPQAAFSLDGRTLAVACWVSGPTLFDVSTGQETSRFTGLAGVHWITYSPDGRWMAVATNARDVYIFPAHQPATEDLRSEIAALIKQFDDDDYATREAASRRLAELAGVALPQLAEGVKSASAEVRVRCRRLLAISQSGAFARKLAGHADELECLAFSKDSKYLASGDWQGVVKIWDTVTWQQVASLARE